MKTEIKPPKKKIKKKIKKTIIGWEEWCSFPELGLPAIKAKIDTGAKTSALHAYDLEPYKKNGEDYLKFKVHPMQKNREVFVQCDAPISDHRYVTSSNGEREKRYVVKTTFEAGEHKFEADITLTARYGMRFRMLFGKDALKKAKFIVDPAKSYRLGVIKDAKDLYS